MISRELSRIDANGFAGFTGQPILDRLVRPHFDSGGAQIILDLRRELTGVGEKDRAFIRNSQVSIRNGVVSYIRPTDIECIGDFVQRVDQNGLRSLFGDKTPYPLRFFAGGQPGGMHVVDVYIALGHGRPAFRPDLGRIEIYA